MGRGGGKAANVVPQGELASVAAFDALTTRNHLAGPQTLQSCW